jgi:hypothetical protein
MRPMLEMLQIQCNVNPWTLGFKWPQAERNGMTLSSVDLEYVWSILVASLLVCVDTTRFDERTIWITITFRFG